MLSPEDGIGPRAALFRLLLAAALLAVPASCRQETVPGPEPAGEGLVRVVEDGPLAVRLETDHREISVAQRLNLVLRVTADEGCIVEMPEIADTLGPFRLVSQRRPPPRLVAGNRLQTRREYLLEPFLAGTYTIPPLAVVAGCDGVSRELTTEPLSLTVRSTLPPDESPPEIRDIVGPVDLPPAVPPWVWGAAGGLLAALGLTVWMVRRGRRAVTVPAPPPLPPHRQALDELERLMADRLPEKGHFKRWYQRISDILRRYIENRFGLRAPEQTTEEFLASLEERRDFPSHHRRLLQRFLGHCDLVKFARLRPAAEDIRQTLESCREFIETTAPPEGARPESGGDDAL